jgi:hypothetical protein
MARMMIPGTQTANSPAPPQRRGAAVVEVSLSWGESTDWPRSRVRDKNGEMVFVGSDVLDDKGKAYGTVRKLLAIDRVEVEFCYNDGAVQRVADPRQMHTRRNL